MANETPPPWLQKFLDGQAALLDKQVSLTASMSQQLADMTSPGPSAPGKGKRLCPKPQASVPVPKKKAKSSHVVEDEDEEFDRRFGHLFNTDGSSHPDEDGEGASENGSDSGDDTNNLSDGEGSIDKCDENNNDDNDNSAIDKCDVVGGDDDDNVSVDNDLVGICDKVVNWEVSPSVVKFIGKSADKKLSEDQLKELSNSYSPDEKLEVYFGAPKLDKFLYRKINRLKNKAAARTEKTLYTAQCEILVSAKPLVAALSALRPLGAVVSKAREQLSVSLGVLFSSSLGISKARRENVRFLFKPALAEALYDAEPNHASLFGGSCFSSQLEKASKTAKLDSTASKRQDFCQPFRSRLGFLGQRFLGKFSYGDSRFGSSQARGFPSSNSNNYSSRKKPYSGKQYAKKRQYQK